jgi:hypothetical protein
VCEWFVDRYLNLWADGPEGHYAVEICDPVEEDVYDIDGVSVSNFVTKPFYSPLAQPNTQFDYLRKLTKGFSVSPGGQIQVRKDGKVQVIHGARFPEWKRETKDFPAARTSRRRKP